MALLVKRKRSSDAVSDAGTGSITDASTPRRDTDEKSQLLALQRTNHAAAKLQLEGVIQQATEQKTHVAAQLQQLEGCEGSTDLRQQLQTYEQQEQQARAELADLDSTFTAAVAGILGIAAEQGATHLAAAVAEQQHLQAAEVEQLAMEQQLAGREFAVTDVIKHRGKRARLERISQVWDWLHHSGGSGEVSSPTGPTASAAARLTSSEGLGSSWLMQKSADALANGHGAEEQQQEERERNGCQKQHGEQSCHGQQHGLRLQEEQPEQQQQHQQVDDLLQQQQQVQVQPLQLSSCQRLEPCQTPQDQHQQGTETIMLQEAEACRQAAASKASHCCINSTITSSQ